MLRRRGKLALCDIEHASQRTLYLVEHAALNRRRILQTSRPIARKRHRIGRLHHACVLLANHIAARRIGSHHVIAYSHDGLARKTQVLGNAMDKEPHRIVLAGSTPAHALNGIEMHPFKLHELVQCEDFRLSEALVFKQFLDRRHIEKRRHALSKCGA